jgi:tetratricopeptide (TPR) repeat protein
MTKQCGNAARRPGLAAVLLALGTALMLQGCALPPARSGTGQNTVEIVSHTVAEGETLSSLAEDYYGSAEAASYLAEVNGLAPDERLEPGDVIDVPVGESDLDRYQNRTEAKVLYNRGTMLAEEGDYEGAREAFVAALRKDPRFVDAGYNLGVVLMAQGEPVRAAAIFEQVLAVRPDDPATEFALGKALFDSDRPEDALPHFERSVTLDPSLEDAWFARAVTLLTLGRRDDGVFALDTYLRRFPDGAWSDQARAELARLATEQR